MQSQTEQALINKFVAKDKQERYLGFISKDKTRKKFTDELYHFKDFNWKLFREIPGNENGRDLILAKLNKIKNIETCQVISANFDIDGKQFPIHEAIQNIVGKEATILIFGNADVVYYEAEPLEGRYISI
jgi:hypothetical protein